MTNPLTILGIVCIIAAIVGGGLSALDVEIPVIESVPRQLLLAAIGGVLIFAGSGGLDKKQATPELPENASEQVNSSTGIANTAEPDNVMSGAPENAAEDSSEPKTYDAVFPAEVTWVSLPDMNVMFRPHSTIEMLIDDEKVDTFDFSSPDNLAEPLHLSLTEGIHTFLFKPRIFLPDGHYIIRSCGGSFHITGEASLVRRTMLEFYPDRLDGRLVECSISVQ